MIDDLKLIHERDTFDALGTVQKAADQLQVDFEFEPNYVPTDILNIVYTGMGGSALAAEFVSVWPEMRVPFQIVRGYDIPAYVGEKTLVIVASYSGNTEESLSALEQAEHKKANIVVITSGGKLAEIARAKHYPVTLLPKVSQPRYAVFYNFKALASILLQADVAFSAPIDFDALATWLSKEAEAWAPTVPSATNPAKLLAKECMGKSVVVYAGPTLVAAGYKWKISFNENAKQIAWFGVYPEFNHNEFIGWSEQPEHKPYTVIDLRSSFDHPRVTARFELSDRLLSGKRPAVHVVEARGETALAQALWASMLGDFVTIYTALLAGQDPAPVDLVEKFKKKLAEI